MSREMTAEPNPVPSTPAVHGNPDNAVELASRSPINGATVIEPTKLVDPAAADRNRMRLVRERVATAVTE